MTTDRLRISDIDPEGLYGYRDVCRLFGKSPVTVRVWRREGKIVPIPAPGRPQFTGGELLRLCGELRPQRPTVTRSERKRINREAARLALA